MVMKTGEAERGSDRRCEREREGSVNVEKGRKSEEEKNWTSAEIKIVTKNVLDIFL
jgi:hypothetical protein